MPAASNSTLIFWRYWVSSLISGETASFPKRRAAQPSATCSRMMVLPQNLARAFMWSMMVRSQGEVSSVTRMRWYMAAHDSMVLSPDNHMPSVFQGVGQAIDIHNGDKQGAAPAREQEEPAAAPPPHAPAGTGELQQGEHGQRQQQAQDQLAEVDQVGNFVRSTAEADDEDFRDDRQSAGDHAPHPGADAPVHE